MGLEENKQLCRDYFAAFLARDTDWMERHIAPEFVRHDPGLPFEVRGPAGVAQLHDVLLSAFPDMELPLRDFVAEGEKVLVRLTVHATHTGAFGELEATGRRIEVPVLDLFQIRDGRLDRALGAARQPRHDAAARRAAGMEQGRAEHLAPRAGGCMASDVPIAFHKGPGTRYRSTLQRPDGAVIALEGGSWNRIGGPVGRVPHDLAHLVVEQRLGLARGLWGVLAGGGLVQNAELGPGPAAACARAREGDHRRRRRGPAAGGGARARDRRRHPRAGAVEVEALRRGIGARWWHEGLTAAAFDAIAAGLAAAAAEWERLAPGASLDRTWHAPVPPRRRR